VNVESFVWDTDSEHLFVMFLDQDGSAIARARADGTGEPQIFYRRRSDVPIRFAGLQNVDGATALLGTLDGPNGPDIVLVSVGDDAEVTPLVATPDAEFDPAASPDERCVAYTSMESGRNEVYLRPFPDGSGRIQVSDAGGSSPYWSRDGRWLLYTPTTPEADPRRSRVAVPTRPGDCFHLGSPTRTAAPPGERVLGRRNVEPPDRKLDVVGIQGWAATLLSSTAVPPPER